MKVFIHSVHAVGHAFACIGMGQAVVARGHQVVFLIEQDFIDRLAQFDFETVALKPAPKDTKGDEQEVKEDDGPKEHPLRGMAKKMIETGLLSNKSSYEKLLLFDSEDQENFFEHIKKDAIAFNPQIEEGKSSESFQRS